MASHLFALFVGWLRGKSCCDRRFEVTTRRTMPTPWPRISRRHSPPQSCGQGMPIRRPCMTLIYKYTSKDPKLDSRSGQPRGGVKSMQNGRKSCRVENCRPPSHLKLGCAPLTDGACAAVLGHWRAIVRISVSILEATWDNGMVGLWRTYFWQLGPKKGKAHHLRRSCPMLQL